MTKTGDTTRRTQWKNDEKNPRLRWKRQGRGEWRAYGDFREFSDVGGKQEALKTSDPDVARAKVDQRVAEFRELQKNKTLYGVQQSRRLEEYAAHHLIKKAKAGNVTKGHLTETEFRLGEAVRFFGATRTLMSIEPPHVGRFVEWLRVERTGVGGGPPKDGTVRKYLNALSHLYTRAQSEGVVPAGFNPVAALMDKPSSAGDGEAKWFEVDDAATILDVASRLQLRKDDQNTGPLQIKAMIATLLLTGCRRSEGFGLLISDVNFQRKTIRVAPNDFRRIKTKTSRRVIPLWPQLEGILTEYLDSKEAPPGELLFPSRRLLRARKKEDHTKDLRKSLDHIAEILEWPPSSIRTKMFRHTYCAARLQTLDRGHPVSIYTVSREMGHGGDGLVKRIYGHLGQFRHRSAVVEYPRELSWYA